MKKFEFSQKNRFSEKIQFCEENLNLLKKN